MTMPRSLPGEQMPSTQRWQERLKQICDGLGFDALAETCGKIGKVRTILINSPPHGTKGLIAETPGTSEPRISKQLSGEEALRADVLMLALRVLRAANLNIAADQIESEFHVGRSSIALKTGTKLEVVEKDGGLFVRIG
jgi:hypothetical protein